MRVLFHRKESMYETPMFVVLMKGCAGEVKASQDLSIMVPSWWEQSLDIILEVLSNLGNG